MSNNQALQAASKPLYPNFLLYALSPMYHVPTRPSDNAASTQIDTLVAGTTSPNHYNAGSNTGTGGSTSAMNSVATPKEPELNFVVCWDGPGGTYSGRTLDKDFPCT